MKNAIGYTNLDNSILLPAGELARLQPAVVSKSKQLLAVKCPLLGLRAAVIIKSLRAMAIRHPKLLV